MDTVLNNTELTDESSVIDSPLRYAICDESGQWVRRSQLWCDQIKAKDLAELEQLIRCEDQSVPLKNWVQQLVDDGKSQRHDVVVPIKSPGDEPTPVDGSTHNSSLMLWQQKIEEAGKQSIQFHLVLLEQNDSCISPELNHLQQRHELILSAAGEGIYGLDINGKTTFANRAAVDILGWHEKDILGASLHDIHHHSYPNGDSYPKENCPIYAAFNDGEIHRVDDEVFWRADGQAVPVEYISTPIIEDGEIQGAVVTFRDISERKEAEAERSQNFEEIKKLKDELELERDYLRDEIQSNVSYGNIIGKSPALTRTLAQIEAVAITPTSVLILGESGVGKEMIARAIHTQSSRANEALVKVNCASIPKDLFESEFFGHIKGSFTGAHRDRVGRMQLANGGTLFLDEIGEIPLDLQGKLLRALQEHEFERVGDEKTMSVDVRIVAATNRDLAEEVKAGRFREDLYYRLSVFPIAVPALKERRIDIPLLAEHFLAEQSLQLGRENLHLSKAQAATLSAMPWPGNIRELRNVIERAVILSSGTRLRLDLALPETPELNHALDDIAVSPEGTITQVLDENEFRDFERSNLLRALQQCNWKVAGSQGAAALLGIKPSTLSYRMNNFDIRRPEK